MARTVGAGTTWSTSPTPIRVGQTTWPAKLTGSK